MWYNRLDLHRAGTPEPEVKWLKDERAIDNERIAIKAEGTRHSLVISKVSADVRFKINSLKKLAEAKHFLLTNNFYMFVDR